MLVYQRVFAVVYIRSHLLIGVFSLASTGVLTAMCVSKNERRSWIGPAIQGRHINPGLILWSRYLRPKIIKVLCQIESAFIRRSKVWFSDMGWEKCHMATCQRCHRPWVRSYLGIAPMPWTMATTRRPTTTCMQGQQRWPPWPLPKTSWACWQVEKKDNLFSRRPRPGLWTLDPPPITTNSSCVNLQKAPWNMAMPQTWNILRDQHCNSFIGRAAYETLPSKQTKWTFFLRRAVPVN